MDPAGNYFLFFILRILKILKLLLSAVRPDRDFMGKQNVLRLPQIKKKPQETT